MAKAASPIRLQQDLMDAASAVAKRMHRSTTEQVEYWASIGRSVDKVIDPDTLLAVTTGLVRLKIEPVEASPLDPAEVFAALESDRESGALAASITAASIRYQASVTHPGQLEQISEGGHLIVGQFHDGVFTPMAE